MSSRGSTARSSKSSSSLMLKAASSPGPHLQHGFPYHTQPGHLLACFPYEDQEGPEHTYSPEGFHGQLSITPHYGHYLTIAASVARRLQAIAAAATTLRESTPAARALGLMGMRTGASASCSHREDRPSPSVPSSSAARAVPVPGPASARSACAIGMASSSGVSASSVKPAARSSARPSYQPAIRAYGMANTAPIETLTERRYSGSAHRVDKITALMPSAAAHRKIAPTLP